MRPNEIRALLFQRKLKSVDISDAMIDSWESVPGLQELTPLKGQLSLVEIKGSDTSNGVKVAKGADGETDDMLIGAYILSQSLVTKDTRERIFTDSDVDAIANFGMSVLEPLQTLLQGISNIAPTSVAKAKADFLPIPVNASSTSSAENSAPVAPEAIANGVNA